MANAQKNSSRHDTFPGGGAWSHFSHQARDEKEAQPDCPRKRGEKEVHRVQQMPLVQDLQERKNWGKGLDEDVRPRGHQKKNGEGSREA